MKIKVSSLINIILGVALLTVVGFGWMYFKQINPVDTVKAVTTVLVDRIPEPKYLFSISGEGKNMLKGPQGIAVDGKTIYVADSGNQVIRVFDYNGKFVRNIGPKVGNVSLIHPISISVVAGQLYVMDPGASKILIIDPNGTSVREFAPGKFKAPASLFGKDNKIYVLDSGVDPKVLIMDSQGNVQKKFGKPGVEKGQLWYPDGIYVDDQNQIWIANTQANRIDLFDENGKLLASFDKEKAKGKINRDGEEKEVSFSYTYPNGLAPTKAGYLVTGNSLAGSVGFIRKDGVIVADLKTINENLAMALVADVFVDDLQRLYAVDYGLNQVFVFDLK